MIYRWDDVPLRGVDGEGSGSFAASRGAKRHKGTDYEFAPGDEVKSPIEGTVTRLGLAYSNAPYRLVEIISHGGVLLWRFLYVDPVVRKGDRVTLGQTIGTAQKISDRYGEKMTDHVHVEVNVDIVELIGGHSGTRD
jgi:murein DD-endopeptidase MepM/ murein hydrolase activator NlpD